MKSVAVFHKIHSPASSLSLSSDSESETVALSYSFSILTGTRLLKYSLNFELSSLFEKAIIEDTKVSKCSAAFFFLVVCTFVAHREQRGCSNQVRNSFAFESIPMLRDYERPFGGSSLHIARCR